MFSKHFQAELSYLREMGREFGRAHPALAGLLSERGGDPDAERLLEGVAFLTARIRERSEAAVPELIQGLVELLLPQYLRPIPACSIVEFSPQIRALRAPLAVPKGTQVGAAPLDGTAVTFRTTSDLTLLPLALLDTTVDYPTSTGPTLRVLLQSTEAGLTELRRAGRLRFFLHGELALSSTLLLWFLRHCRSVQLRDPDQQHPAVQLPGTALRAPGFDLQESLFPWPRVAIRPYRLLQEYFTLPQRFLFVELSGLEGVPASRDKLEILFHFDRPSPLPGKLPRDALRLHCVPVINLFEATGEPVRIKALEEEHLLRPADLDPRHVEVYSVESVVGVGAGRGDRQTIAPFASFAHFPSGSFYRLRRSASPVDGGLDTRLSLGSAHDVAPQWQDQTLSTELTCTHRLLPARLGVGDLSVATRTSPALARFTNLVAVSPPVRPPLDTELQWRLLSHLTLSRLSLAGKTELKALLELYNFQVESDLPAARANTLRIEAIRAMDTSRQRSFIRGTSVFGQRTHLELDESGFAGPGDLFLFGQVLDQILAANLTLNSFHELSIRSSPSRMDYAWTPRSGIQALI